MCRCSHRPGAKGGKDARLGLERQPPRANANTIWYSRARVKLTTRPRSQNYRATVER